MKSSPSEWSADIRSAVRAHPCALSRRPARLPVARSQGCLRSVFNDFVAPDCSCNRCLCGSVHTCATINKSRQINLRFEDLRTPHASVTGLRRILMEEHVSTEFPSQTERNYEV